MATLLGFCRDNGIVCGWISGLGAFEKAEIGYYYLSHQQYDFKVFEEELELTNLTGNIALDGDELVLHLHATVGDRGFHAFAGHLKEATIGASCEIYLTPIDARVTRTFDPEIGLKLLDL